LRYHLTRRTSLYRQIWARRRRRRKRKRKRMATTAAGQRNLQYFHTLSLLLGGKPSSPCPASSHPQLLHDISPQMDQSLSFSSCPRVHRTTTLFQSISFYSYLQQETHHPAQHLGHVLEAPTTVHGVAVLLRLGRRGRAASMGHLRLRQRLQQASDRALNIRPPSTVRRVSACRQPRPPRDGASSRTLRHRQVYDLEPSLCNCSIAVRPCCYRS
jgi:hypothetical protein